MSKETTARPSLASFTLSAGETEAINNYLRSNPRELLQIPYVRHLLAAARLQRVKPEEVRTLSEHSPAVIQNAIEHNLAGLHNLWALDRPARLINPLCSSNFIMAYQKTLKVLTVGPRTEAEILTLIAAGFEPENIRGLDLISYSDMVDLGDMHDMPYADGSFDVVILGWVLGYSTDNPRVASEVLRVARSGAVVAIGCEYNPLSNEELARLTKISLVDATRFDHTDQMLRLFEGHVESILFRHDVHPALRQANNDLMVVFQLKA